MSEVTLAKVDVAQKLLQLTQLDPHEVEQGVGIWVLLEESLEERTTGCQDHLVSIQLATILGGQSHIRQVCVKPEFFEGFWAFVVEIVPGESEHICHIK